MAKKNEVIIIDISLETKDIPAKLAAIKNETQKLKLENAELAKAYKEAFNAGNAASMKRISEQMAENETQLKRLGTQYTQYNQTLNKVFQQEKAKAGSYEDLLREYELEQTILKQRMDMIVINEKGERVLSEAYKQAAAELKKKKDVLDAFNKGIGDNRNLVGSYADAIKEAFANGNLFSGQLSVIGNAFKVAKGGADIFKNGINGVGAAIKATPIGLITSGFQLLQGVIGKNNAALEFFGAVTKSVGSVLNSIVGIIIKFGKFAVEAFTKPSIIIQGIGSYIENTLVKAIIGVTDVLTGLFTFNFDKVLGGFKDIGGSIKNTVKPALDARDAIDEFAGGLVNGAKNAFTLAQRIEALEDREREFGATQEKNRQEIDKLIKSARERTDSEEQRLAILEKAAALEKETLAEELAIAEERLAITKKENEGKAKKLQLLDEDRQKEADLAREVERIKGESAIKQQEIDNRTATLNAEIRKQQINSEKETLDARLAIAEANGQETIALRKEIAAKERDAELSEFGITEAQKEAIRQRYQAKIISLEKEFQERIKAVRQQLTDLNIAAIEDEGQRELIALLESQKRKLDAIKGYSKEERALRMAIAEETARLVQDLNAKVAQEDLQTSYGNIEARQEAALKSVDAEYQAKENALKEAASKDAELARRLSADTLALQLQKQQQELSILQNTQTQKNLAIDAAITYEKGRLEEQFEDGKITREQYGKEVQEVEAKYAKERVVINEQTGDAIVTKEQETQNTKTEIVVQGNTAVVESDRQATALQNQYMNLRADLASTLISGFVDVLGELDGEKKKFGVLIKALSVAEIAVNLSREIQNIRVMNAAVAATMGPAGPAYLATATPIMTGIAIANAAFNTRKVLAQKFAVGGFTDTHAQGGFVRAPKLGLIGEAGAEWVSPNWMLTNPVTSPIIERLEEIRRGGRPLPFADGGFTAQYRQQIAMSGVNTEAVVEAFDGALKKVTIVADASEITSTQTNTARISDGATI